MSEHAQPQTGRLFWRLHRILDELTGEAGCASAGLFDVEGERLLVCGDSDAIEGEQLRVGEDHTVLQDGELSIISSDDTASLMAVLVSEAFFVVLAYHRRDMTTSRARARARTAAGQVGEILAKEA